MWKYYFIKFKSLLRVFPYLFVAIAVLFSCLFLAFGAAFDASQADQPMRFRLALVCSDEDPYFKAGLDIVQAYDSSRFAIDALQMEEDEARIALEKGQLDAYVVIPAGYIGDAMSGCLGSLKFVSTTGAAELTTLFKDEITGIVADIIIACEKGMYGVENIAGDYGFEDKAGSYIGEISLKYVDFILERSDMYYVDELGIHDSLGLDGYLFSGITVLVLSIMMIPASVCFIGQDLSVHRLLKSKNIGAGMQVIGEYMALLTVLLIPVMVIFGAGTFMKPYLPPELERLVRVFTVSNAAQIIVIVMMLAAFGYYLFQLADELVGGIVLYFFTTLGICFISGCIFPVYFFPDTVRNIAQYTPQALCRSVISGCIVKQGHNGSMLLLMLYTVILLLAAYITRIIRLRSTKR